LVINIFADYTPCCIDVKAVHYLELTVDVVFVAEVTHKGLQRGVEAVDVDVGVRCRRTSGGVVAPGQSLKEAVG
jgi:hypothetical protein